jgi:hypothetical protein
LKGFVHRAAALFTLLSVAAAVFFAGTSYFFCPSMERAVKGCCCPTEPENVDEPAVSRAPCRNRKTLAAAPSAPTESLRQATSVPPANIFPGELVPIADGHASDAPDLTRRWRHGARAGPTPSLFDLHSAYLI